MTRAFGWAGHTQALHGLHWLFSPIQVLGGSCSVSGGQYTPHAPMGMLQAEAGLL